MSAALDEIQSAFELFDDWEDTYRFIIDLGKSLPALPDAQKTEDRLVRGCQSQVWLIPHHDAETGRLRFAIDSDAHIVRGLIAIMLAAYDDKPPADILAYDIEALFRELDLLRHLSPTRGNGLRAMVGKIRSVAGEMPAPSPIAQPNAVFPKP